MNFNKKFDNIHDLAVTVGCTQQKNVSDIFEAKATQIPITSEWRGIEALDEGLSQKIMSKKLTEWAIQSFIFRSNYNYDRKYYLTFTMRADGSSKFARDNRWGKFYSGAVRWRFSDENFVKNNIGSENTLIFRRWDFLPEGHIMTIHSMMNILQRERLSHR